MKKTHKKVFIKIASAVLAVFSFFTLSGMVRKQEETLVQSRLTVNEKNSALSFEGDGDIKILQLSDVQVSNAFVLKQPFAMVEKLVDETQPDLIVLTGDNLGDDCSVPVFFRFISFMDSFEIPWAPVLGNHDYNTKVPVAYQAKKYEDSEYCIFREGNIPGSYGNYAYTVERDGNAVHSMIFMDSGVDGFTKEHTSWYENTVRSLAKQNGGKVLPSWAFFHIPTKETALAYEACQNGKAAYDGEINEKVGYQEKDVGFFDKVKKLKSTSALIYGHDHVNSLITEYKGVSLCYALKSSNTSYYQSNLLGANLFRLKNDNSFTVERVFI